MISHEGVPYYLNELDKVRDQRHDSITPLQLIAWMQTTLSLLPSTHAAFVSRLVNDSYQPLVPHHTRRASGLLIHHLCILPAELIAFRERSSCAA
jgi:hypothetical protein